MLFPFIAVSLNYLLLPVALVWWTFLTVFRFLTSNWRVTGSGKHVLITGCDSGFGKSAALLLSKKGFTVFAGCLTDQGQTDLEDVKKVDKDVKRNLHPVHLNVTTYSNVRAVVESATKDKGLWALINNAGVLGLPATDEWLKVEDYKEVYEVNVFGTIRMVHAFLPLVQQAKGRVINTCSFVGHVAVPTSGPYVTSKHAVTAYTSMLRKEMSRHRVRVIEVAPGASATNLTNLNVIMAKYEQRLLDLPKLLRSRYDQDYLHRKRKSLELGLSAVGEPDAVANAYFDAVTQRFPKPAYWVGWDTNWIFRPLSSFPDEIQDWQSLFSLICIRDPG